MKSLITKLINFIRFLYQTVYLAVEQIWANRMRSVLTMLGIIIGVASVTAIIAALSGFRAKILSQVEGDFGTNRIFVSPKRPTSGPLQYVGQWQIRFQAHHFEGLQEHCPSVKRFGRYSWGGRHTVVFRDKSSEGVRVQGMEPACLEIEGRTYILGRPLSLMDEIQARYVCIIDPELRNKLRLKRDCIGQKILIGHNTFVIVGVMEAKPNMFTGEGNSENLEVFIPFKTNMKLMDHPWVEAMAESKSAETSEDALAELKFFLRQTRGINPGDPDTFMVMSLKSALKSFNEIASVAMMVTLGIVSISLIVGGVGIMNIMLVSVTERTREIGLRKAVGARQSAVLTQFLIESVVLCSIGGLIGIGFGQLFTVAIANIPNINLDMAYIPGWAIVLALVFSTVVGLSFGMFPAIKAARLDPIEALRNE